MGDKERRGGFEYELVSSVLHDASSVEAIFDEYRPLLESLGGRRQDLDEVKASTGPVGRTRIFFVLTGGTEGIVLRRLGLEPSSERTWPIVLLAHPKHNSLPAAMEIAARLGQEGVKALLVLLRGTEDAEGKAALERALELVRLAEGMRATKIGAVGQPSDWLVASSQSAQDIRETWGVSMESASLEELRSAMAAAAIGPGERAIGDAFLAGASYRREIGDGDVDASLRIYAGLKALAERHGWNALSLRCFDLVVGEKATGCFALSELADEGLDAGCEGDVASIVALRWTRLLSGLPGWMANPSDIRFTEGRAEVLLAHCTVPRSLTTGYGARSHFESGLGVAVAGTLPSGPVTLVRLGGKRLEKAWVAEGELLPVGVREGLCRTQALVRLPEGELRRLLAQPLGNHLVLGLGGYGKKARQFLDAAGIELV